MASSSSPAFAIPPASVGPHAQSSHLRSGESTPAASTVTKSKKGRTEKGARTEPMHRKKVAILDQDVESGLRMCVALRITSYDLDSLNVDILSTFLPLPVSHIAPPQRVEQVNSPYVPTPNSPSMTPNSRSNRYRQHTRQIICVKGTIFTQDGCVYVTDFFLIGRRI